MSISSDRMLFAATLIDAFYFPTVKAMINRIHPKVEY